MKDSFQRGVIGAVLVMALLVCGVVYWNRYSITLSVLGFSPRATQVICGGIDANGHNYRAVAHTHGGKYETLALLTENALGWWEATQVSDQAAYDNDLIGIAWIDTAGFRWVDETGDLEVDFAFHNIYCGNNAVDAILPITEKLPPNVTVDIHQSGSSYLLHFISFGNGSALNGLSVEELLRSVGAIL